MPRLTLSLTQIPYEVYQTEQIKKEVEFVNMYKFYFII